MPTIEVLPSTPPESPGPHTVEIRLLRPAPTWSTCSSTGATSSWSISESESDGRHFVWVGTRDPLTFRIESVRERPVNVHLKAYYLGSAVSVDEVLARLPLVGADRPDRLETSTSF